MTNEEKCYKGNKYKYYGDFCTPMFGLSMAHWTGNRSIDLLNEYIYYKYINKIGNNPNISQCTKVRS